MAALDLGPAETPYRSPSQPRVLIRTLGGLQVEVDGKPVVWKRSNSRLILLDLLLHPEGSTPEDLERRYWRTTGNSSLRNDIQALRLTLEPGIPASQSSFVQLRNKRYVWAGEPSAYLWDVQAVGDLCSEAKSSEDPAIRRQKAIEALKWFRGTFLPEFTTYQAFASHKVHVQRLHDEALAWSSPD